MKRKITPIIYFLFLYLISSITLSANPIYTLAAGEEFVYGKIGTFEDGSLKYTLAIVRKRNENKTFYRMGFSPYHPGIVQGSGNLKPYENPREYNKYDVYVLFNGKKFGPYDAIYDMNFLEPNPDKWVSNDGKTISFCGQQGKKFMGVVHNTERSMFWVPSQHLNIDLEHNEDIFTLEYAKGDIRMYIDGKRVHPELNFFGELKHADNGDLLYFAKNRNTNEGALYVNHKKTVEHLQNYSTYGFIKGTNTIYYKVLLPNKMMRVCIGEHSYDFSPEHRISSFYFIKDYIAFNVQEPKSKNTLFYEYNLKTRKMNQHGPYEVTRLRMLYNKLAYQIMLQTKESDGYAHTYYFRNTGGELIDKFVAKPNTLDNAYMHISPKGDIYIIKKISNTFHITKNGAPYPFDGTISRILFEDFLPSTDELVLLSEVKSDIKHSYNNEARLTMGSDTYNFKGNYILDSRAIADEARVVYSISAAPADDNKHQTIYKNGQNVLDKAWKFIERPTIDSKGEHFAVKVFNYGDNWMVNSVIGDYPDNGCMHQDWHLIVDGKERTGKYGSPAYLKKDNKLVAICQEGNNLVIKDLLTNQNYSGINNQATNVSNDNGYVKFQNYWKKTYINIESGLTCGDIAPGWHSAMWIIEPSEGNYVKIKNRWKGTYLNVEYGQLQCTEIQPGWHSAMWLIEPIPGTNEVRIKNRWKNTYLNMESGSLHCTDINSDWHSARWTLNSLNKPALTVAYDANSGCGTFHLNGKELKKHCGWNKNWYKILVVGCADGATHAFKVLFYAKDTGTGAIYKVDNQGNMTLLQNHSGWRNNWSQITWEAQDNCNGVIRFESADGYWEKYHCNDQGNLILQAKKQ